MGTRSLTYLYEENAEKPFMCMYRQFDGYPKGGHGQELGEFLAPFTIVNGFTEKHTIGNYANGMGCLGAQMIAHFKKAVGNHYIVDPLAQEDGWQEYEYHVFTDRVEVYACYDPKVLIFSGSYKSFLKWAENPPRDADDEYIVTTLAKKTITYTDLNSALAQANVRVKFTKNDGTIRVMECTKNPDTIPEDALNRIANGHKAAAPVGLYRVWDIEKQDWRSFKEERLIDWKVL